jgi:hypothetical protein
VDILKKLKDNVMGTDEQNKAAQERMDKAKKQSKYVNNQELLAPMQAAFDKYEKKKADEKIKFKEERDASRSKSMTMDEMNMKSGGKVSSASKRADGCAIRGKTRA